MPVPVQCLEMLSALRERVRLCERCTTEHELAALRRIVNAIDAERAVIGRLCELPTLEDEDDLEFAEKRNA